MRIFDPVLQLPPDFRLLKLHTPNDSHDPRVDSFSAPGSLSERRQNPLAVMKESSGKNYNASKQAGMHLDSLEVTALRHWPAPWPWLRQTSSTIFGDMGGYNKADSPAHSKLPLYDRRGARSPSLYLLRFELPSPSDPSPPEPPVGPLNARGVTPALDFPQLPGSQRAGCVGNHQWYSVVHPVGSVLAMDGVLDSVLVFRPPRPIRLLSSNLPRTESEVHRFLHPWHPPSPITPRLLLYFVAFLLFHVLQVFRS